jgi:hypothetical protein
MEEQRTTLKHLQIEHRLLAGGQQLVQSSRFRWLLHGVEVSLALSLAGAAKIATRKRQRKGRCVAGPWVLTVVSLA